MTDGDDGLGAVHDHPRQMRDARAAGPGRQGEAIRFSETLAPQ